MAFTRTDGDGSGAVATEYAIGDGDWTPYTGAFVVDGLGGHRVDFRSIDVVGNVENFRSVVFTIRSAPPTVTGAQPQVPSAQPAQPFAALDPPAARRATLTALRQRPLRRAGELPVAWIAARCGSR